MSSRPVSLFSNEERFSASAPAAAAAAAAPALAERPHQVALREDSVQTATRLVAALNPGESVIVVTGCHRQDDAAGLAAQLTMALARITREAVALADADAGRPLLDQLFGAERSPGLREMAEGTAGLPEAVRHFAGGVSLVPAGSGGGVLPAPGCAQAVAALRAQFRFVVIATGPVLQQAEAVTMASLADGVVLALRAGRRSRGEVQDVQRELARLKVRFLGAVLRHS